MNQKSPWPNPVPWQFQNGSNFFGVVLVWSFVLSPLAQSLLSPRLESMSSCPFFFSYFLTSWLHHFPQHLPSLSVSFCSGSVLWSRYKLFPWPGRVDSAVTVLGSDRHHDVKQLVPKGRSKLLPSCQCLLHHWEVLIVKTLFLGSSVLPELQFVWKQGFKLPHSILHERVLR